MIDLGLSQTQDALLALVIVAVMLVAFVRETFPVEVTAVAGAATMLLVGIIPEASAMAVFSNPAPWTIAALFVIVGALVRTGALNWITASASANAVRSPVLTLGALALTVIAMSAFMNNTPIVVVMIPIFMQLSRELALSPSKLMIPLSYLSILGGTITLIGTSTNLVVDGVARSHGLAPFSIFEVAPVGLLMAVIGLAYLALFGRHLLPDRTSMSGLIADRGRMKFFTEVAVPEGSSLIGRKLEEVELFRREGARVIDVLRGDASLRRNLGEVVLEAGDRVVLRTPMSEVLEMQSHRDVRALDKLSSVRTATVEVLITPGCRMVGRTLGELRLRRRYGVYPIAVHRRNQNIGRQLDDLVVAVGDTLLLEGNPEDIQRLAADMDMVDIARPSERPFRRRHAPLVLVVMGAIVVFAALDLAPIVLLAFLGVAVVLLTRCIDADEAFSFIDGRLLALIFGMLGVGAGLEHSGAVALLVGAVAPFMVEVHPVFLVLAVYMLTSILTELVTNNAVAVIVTPIAIGLGVSLGVDPRPLVVAVMLAASASFCTPIGYQTNTLVYGPGGYRFTDYVRVGLPLNLMLAAVVSVSVPLIWPL
ncbi:MAG: SLC13 family permease [Alkalilacustris sp.]